MTRRARGWRAVVAALTVLAVAGCASGPILANPPVERPIPPLPTSRPSPPPDPQPVRLPDDDAPHDRLTEWWYYTGHLRDTEGGRWGFEYVIFRAERGDFPVAWASHLALTDETGDHFWYAERSEIGPQVDLAAAGGSFPAGSFVFAIRGADPADPATFLREPWTMAGRGGLDRLAAAFAPDEVARAGVPGELGLALELREARPPVLHDGDGWIDFGPAGGSYYYSRTRMAAVGTLQVGERMLAVEGLAWFDHQWGDFIAIGGGGWDWFAVNLDDGTDLTISLVRDADGSYPLVYGTLVRPDDRVVHLPETAFSIEVTADWTSSRTGATYPAGWRIEVPGEGLTIELRPTVADQELDTRATTGVVYWEGSQVVRAERDGRPMGGEAYVELTGYAVLDRVPLD